MLNLLINYLRIQKAKAVAQHMCVWVWKREREKEMEREWQQELAELVVVATLESTY